MSGEAFFRPGTLEHSGACPDCDATTELVDHGHGLWLLEIRHDDTCPTYRRLLATGRDS